MGNNNIEVIEEISDDKLLLRKVTTEDAAFFFETLNDKQIIKYLSLGPIRNLDHAKRLIKSYLKYWESYRQYNYVMELKNARSEQSRKIGSVSLWSLSWIHRRASIGIWLHSKYWNQGLAKRTLDLIKIIAFKHLKLHRLEAHIAFDNMRSVKLFEKCGFAREGVLKEYLNFNGAYHDAHVLACLNHHAADGF